MRGRIVCLFLCCVGVSSTLHADEVYLKNGDRLSGQIVRMTDGKLIFLSGVVGEVTVNLTDIKTFNSNEPVEVHLKDGTVLHQPVAAAEPNEFALKTAAPLQPQKFSLADVASINPPAKPQPKWTGSISGAVTSTHGNTKADSVAASVSVLRRSDKDRTTAGADYGRSEQRGPTTHQDETTEDWWRARAQYDYFFTKKFFGFINARYERDAIADLDRRIVVGGGAGYQWIETDKTSFSTNLGLASVYEKFDNVPSSNSEISLQLGYSFEKRFNEKLRFIQDLTYFPSLEQFSDYFLTSTAELRASLTKSMFANFKVIFSYDESPAPGQGSTDVKYLLGVGVNF
jgi:putative salt-induced outer membrane protein YdiY